MMKTYKLLLIIAFVILFKSGFSQEIAEGKYWIQFTDKNNTSYSIFKPNEFLSERAIERRLRYHIPIDQRDLPVDSDYIRKIKQAGGQVLNISRWFNAAVVKVHSDSIFNKIIQLPFVKNTQIKANEYRENQAKPLVHELDDYVTDHFNVWDSKIVKIKKRTYPANRFDYGKAFNQIEMLSAYDLHNLGMSGQGIEIAVIDAGFYEVHKLPSFKKLWEGKQIKGMKDFVDGDTTVFDASYHGMKVLSTIGGNIPGEIVGTAPDASFWLFRTEDAATENIIEEANWVSAAEYADSLGVDLLTTSLGYNDFDTETHDYSKTDLNGRSGRMNIGSNVAASKGMVVVTSAGNTGFESWELITIPGDADSVITVGSVNRFGNYSYFSSKGPTADNRVKPNVVARGSSSVVQDPGGKISYSSGTSFSCPILAGTAACLLQAHRYLTPTAIISAINTSANNYSTPNRYTGYGLPDFTEALLFPDVKNKRTNIGLDAFNFWSSHKNELFLKSDSPEVIYHLPFFVDINVYDTSRKKMATFYGQPKYSNQSGLIFPEFDSLSRGAYLFDIVIEEQYYSAIILK